MQNPVNHVGINFLCDSSRRNAHNVTTLIAQLEHLTADSSQNLIAWPCNTS